MRDVPSVLAGLATSEADFSEFGSVEIEPLSRIQQLTGAFLGRNWVTVPHLTHHDEIDVTEAEQRRFAWNASHPDAKVTPVAMLVRAMAVSLKKIPKFNASLGASSTGRMLRASSTRLVRRSRTLVCLNDWRD